MMLRLPWSLPQLVLLPLLPVRLPAELWGSTGNGLLLFHAGRLRVLPFLWLSLLQLLLLLCLLRLLLSMRGSLRSTLLLIQTGWPARRQRRRGNCGGKLSA